MKKKQLSIYSLALASLLVLPLGSLTSCSDKEETDVFASEELSLNMTLTPTIVDLPARNASQDITITSNTAWGAVSDVTWTTLSTTLGVGNGSLSVKLEDNTGTEPRTATITISYGSTQQTVTINQAAATASLSTQEVTLPARDATQEISITTNSAWTASSYDTWIHIINEKGDGDGKFTFNLDNNLETETRQGTINVTYGQGKMTITVNQQPATASLSTQEVTLPARDASQEIGITTNSTWTVSTFDTWIHFLNEKGDGDGKFTFTLDNNLNTQIRQGTIAVTYGNGKMTINVTQEPATATLSDQSVSFTAKSSSHDIKVTSNTVWSAEAENSWIHTEDAEGEVNGRFTIKVDDNKSLSSRQGKVTFNYGTGKQTITISQKAASATKFEKTQANNIGRYQADITGIFNSEFDVTEYGVIYSATSSVPTIGDDKSHQIAVGKTPISQDIVSTTIKGLKAGSKNYARIYTKGPLGTEYSPVVTFVTSGGAPSSNDNPTPGY